MALKKILMVIAPDAFRDEEFFEPYNHFTQDQHWQVCVASTKTGTASGMLGGTWSVEHTVQSQSADAFDALVVVGGMGSPTYLWNHEDLLHLVRKFAQQNKVVSAICLSGVVLAKAGILEGKQATVWEMPESVAAFEEANAKYIKQDVVQDGLIITANGPHAASEFARTIAQQLNQIPSVTN